MYERIVDRPVCSGLLRCVSNIFCLRAICGEIATGSFKVVRKQLALCGADVGNIPYMGRLWNSVRRHRGLLALVGLLAWPLAAEDLTLVSPDAAHQAAAFSENFLQKASAQSQDCTFAWQKNPGTSFRGGFSRHPYWIRIPVQNNSANDTWILSLNNNRLDLVDLRVINEDVDVSAIVCASAESPQTIPVLYSGDLRAVSERNLKTPYPAFRVRIVPGEKRALLLRVQSSSLLSFHMILESPESFALRRSQELSIQALYAAFGLIYLIGPVLCALVFRRPVILGISVLAWSVLLVGFIQAGDANVLLWPESPWFSWPALITVASLFFFSSVEFTRRVLQLSQHQPRMNRLFLFIELFVVLAWLIGLVRPTPLYSITISLCAIGHIFMLLFVQVRALRYGRHYVWFMLAGTLLIGSGMIVRHLTVLGVFEYHPVLQNAGVLLYPIDLLAWTAAFVLWSRRLEMRQSTRETIQTDQASSRSRIRNIAVPEVLAGIRRLLDEEEIYRQPELTLADMAARLNIRADQLSAVLNLEMQTNFAELINRARIDEACRLLRADTQQTILDIAYEVGFGSKAAFNRAFNRLRGETAAEYRRSSSKQQQPD